LIEEAYRLGEGLGPSAWCADQAGPFQTVPHPGQSWRPEGEPARQPREYVRDGTAKVLTLFHPAGGAVRVEGVTSCPNSVLRPWLKGELEEVLAGLAGHPPTAQASRQEWERWQQGLPVRPAPAAGPPPLRVLLILDNLSGHKTPELVPWLFAHGVMPVYTPVSGGWLNLAEGIQRVLKRRALDGQHPQTAGGIMAWFGAVARQWNRGPTPFRREGRRECRRDRQRQRRHRVGGSGGYTSRPVRRRKAPTYGHERAK
jgi:hypothetical protein